MKQYLGTTLLLIGTMGWWGFVYPELCLTPEYCEAAEKPEEKEPEIAQIKEWQKEKVLSLPEEEEETEKICIKSRLYEYICQVREKD